MNFEIVAPLSHTSLAELIGKHLAKTVVVPHITRFADSELEVRFNEPELLNDKIVFIVQSTNMPVHDNFMQFLLMVHKVKAAGGQKIIAVIPYCGYSRQDSISATGKKGSLELIACIMQASGVSELITVDFHSDVIDTYFSIPVHNIQTIGIIADHAKKILTLNNACVVSPDKGSQKVAALLAQKLNSPYVTFTKERYGPNKTRITSDVSLINTETAIIIDDIIDTGDTALSVCEKLHHQGVTEIYGYFVHPVLSDDAVQSIEHSYFNKIFVSNSIDLDQVSTHIESYDCSALIAQKIKQIVTQQKVLT